MRKWLKAGLWAGTVPALGIMLWLFLSLMSIFPKLFRGDLRGFEYNMALFLAPPVVVWTIVTWAAALLSRHYRKTYAAAVLDEARSMGIAVLLGLAVVVVHAKYPAWVYAPLAAVIALWLLVLDKRPVHPWRRALRLVALIAITFAVFHHSVHY